jgi:hypothetical protein
MEMSAYSIDQVSKPLLLINISRDVKLIVVAGCGARRSWRRVLETTSRRQHETWKKVCAWLVGLGMGGSSLEKFQKHCWCQTSCSASGSHGSLDELLDWWGLGAFSVRPHVPSRIVLGFTSWQTVHIRTFITNMCASGVISHRSTRILMCTLSNIKKTLKTQTPKNNAKTIP